MLEGKELWTGCLALDEAQGVLHLGKQAVLVAEIEEAQLCRGAVRFGKKDADQGIQTPLLCLRLKTPATQPGKKIGFRKSRNLVLRPEDWALAENIAKRLPHGTGREWTAQDFPMDQCIVEAKRGCCDYIRGGTAGSNAYGRRGRVSPVVTPELHLERAA